MTANIFLLSYFIPFIMIPMIRGIWWFFFADKDAKFCPGDMNGELFLVALTFWPFLFGCSLLIGIAKMMIAIGDIIVNLRKLRFKE